MQRHKKHIVIVAGEASGDLHAASFARELFAKNPNLTITGIGGQQMQQAGVKLVSDLARYGVTGITEVFRHFLVIRRAFKDIQKHLSDVRPDLLVLVDYPGFNLRLARFAKKKLGLRVLYYISPQIWAWKANRIHTIRACVDKMAVIFPFEKKIYEAHGVPVAFVGHPLMQHIHETSSPELPTNKRVIAFLPGSRRHEIERHMPILIKSAIRLSEQLDDLHFVIPCAPTIDENLIHAYFKNTPIPYTVTSTGAVPTAKCADCIVVASGTASLECALLEKPMCIIYKVSWLTFILGIYLVNINYLGLCNILQNRMIVPELLQADCNTHELTRIILNLLEDKDLQYKIQSQLKTLKSSLSMQKADTSVCALIENLAMLDCSSQYDTMSP